MRSPFLLPLLTLGCTTAQPTDESADKHLLPYGELPDDAVYDDPDDPAPVRNKVGRRAVPHQYQLVEDYLDLDAFCADQGFESASSFAIGYRQILPWATSVLCLEQEGIYEIATTHNGRDSDSRLAVPSYVKLPPMWADRPSMLVQIGDDRLGRCPMNGAHPIAIISEYGAVSGLCAEVTYGKRICVEGPDIAVYDFDGKERHRFEGFTPYMGGPFSE